MRFMRRKKSYKIWARRRRTWPLVLAGAILIVILVVGIVQVTYTNNLKPVSTSQQTSYFTIQSGSGVKQIASDLKSAGLIRSSTAFETYVRGHGLFDKIQAGTYSLSPSMSVQQIVQKMVNGDVARNLLTILPGKRLDQIKQKFTDAGYSSSDIQTAFDPATYQGDPALSSLPAGASLEGYLYPDSFQQTSATPASAIVKESIDELGQKLTPAIINGFKAHGLSVYQGITLASIVYQETDNPTYEPTVAQVFMSRMAQNMPLQSNVTANYAADELGVARSTSINSPYNTYLHTGLPPGPIGNFTKQALAAVANPSSTDYLYFVADEQTHAVYFSHTQAEQNAQAQQHCPNTCQ